jgi:dihydrofolate synthase / folylpolyglutamate synthase
MRSFTYSEIENRLMAMPRFQDVGSRAARFGIDQIREFSESIGSPEVSFKSIHVAGTNGKGTVCSILASVLKEQGYKVGLYTSPHLKDVRERFRIDGEMIPEEVLIDFFNQHDLVLRQYPLTFFELTTAIAFWWFSRNNVDIAIIETGLGGRLDATNILNPLVSVITSIGMDHMEQLGSTIQSIAFEKAGIIKSGTPYVLGEIDATAVTVISEYADSVGAFRYLDETNVIPLHDGQFSIARNNQLLRMYSDLYTPYLKTNIKTVVQSLNSIQNKLFVSNDAIIRGLAKIGLNSGLTGRFQKLKPDLDWFFDGGHNSQALLAVQNHLSEIFPKRNPVIILTLMEDKLTDESIEILNKYDQVYYIELPVSRALSFERFNKIFPKSKSLSAHKNDFLEASKYFKRELVLFTGSFYFYSTVSEWMESLSLDSNCAENPLSTKNQNAKN